jgi:hypothetical protein
MPYYKVCVRNHNDRLVSAVVRPVPKFGFVSINAHLEYRVGAWTGAPHQLGYFGYDPCVFDSLIAARNFSLRNVEIYECEVKGITPYDDLPSTLDVYRLQVSGNFNESYMGWPKGTVMAKWVRLVRKVD